MDKQYNDDVCVFTFPLNIWFVYIFSMMASFVFIQAVYNANKYAKLVRKRERLQNWLDYNQLKFERHPEKRPTRKVVCSYELKSHNFMC